MAVLGLPIPATAVGEEHTGQHLHREAFARCAKLGYTGDRFAKEMPRGSAQPEAVARTVGAPWQERFYYRARPPSRCGGFLVPAGGVSLDPEESAWISVM